MALTSHCCQNPSSGVQTLTMEICLPEKKSLTQKMGRKFIKSSEKWAGRDSVFSGSCDICFLTKHVYVRSKPKVLETFLGNLVLGENLFYIHYVFLVQAQAMHQLFFSSSLIPLTSLFWTKPAEYRSVSSMRTEKEAS